MRKGLVRGAVLPTTVLLAAVQLAATAQEAQRRPDAPGVLPLELAFDKREFLWDAGPAVSPDGMLVAYSVRDTPEGMNLDVRYQPSGSPSSVVGSRVFISRRDGGDPIDVCPDAGNCWRPSWAPGGQSIAFYSDAGGYPQLWMFDLGAEQPRRVSEARVKAKLWAGDQPRWSPDGALLYVPLSPDQSAEGDFSSFTAARAEQEGEAAAGSATVTVLSSGNEATVAGDGAASRPMADFMMFENNASMAAIDVASGEARVLVAAETVPRPSVLRLSPSGKWLSYLSVFKPGGETTQVTAYDLGVVATAGGNVEVLAEDLPVGRDYHGQNYSWHPTEDRLVYLENDQLWLVDFGTEGPGEARRLGGDLGPLSPVPLWFTRDGEAVVVGVEPFDPQDYLGPRPTGLARVPLDRTPPALLTLGAEWDFQAMVRANETTLFQPDGHSAMALLRHRTTGESAVARLDFDPTRQAAPVPLWRGIARIRGFASADQASIVAFYEDAATPPDVYLFNADFSERTAITAVDDRLDAVDSPAVEIIEVEVPLYNGEMSALRTAILLPPGAKRGDRLPGIVMIYPGGDVTRHVEWYGGGSTVSLPTHIFVSRGYAVILVNLTLGPDAEPGNPMQEMVDVLLPQVYRAAELGYVEVTRLGITGQSFGGYGTASIVSRTNLFRAAVAISGIYDLAGTYGHLGDGYTGFWVGWSEGGQARMGDHPWANVRRYLDNSPYYQADKIHTPLLLVHGDEDNAYHDAEKLFSALRRLERDAQLAIYHGQGHVVSDWSQPNAVDAAARMLEFFDKHLGVQR